MHSRKARDGRGFDGHPHQLRGQQGRHQDLFAGHKDGFQQLAGALAQRGGKDELGGLQSKVQGAVQEVFALDDKDRVSVQAHARLRSVVLVPRCRFRFVIVRGSVVVGLVRGPVLNQEPWLGNLHHVHRNHGWQDGVARRGSCVLPGEGLQSDNVVLFGIHSVGLIGNQHPDSPSHFPGFLLERVVFFLGERGFFLIETTICCFFSDTGVRRRLFPLRPGVLVPARRNARSGPTCRVRRWPAGPLRGPVPSKAK
mmetsp:Transcript_18797/g.42961  ORF Transcript_18797/g.42961 Transcript_18797/m.42961 type:complete len:254 (-) Transcript_18797:787-1548(-)